MNSYNYKQHKMHMNETIIVFSIIDKLHLSWKNFKRSMQHKKFDLINWKVILEQKNIYLK